MTKQIEPQGASKGLRKAEFENKMRQEAKKTDAVKKTKRELGLLQGAGLSTKLLLLTILFVMLVEILVLIPSIANFRNNWVDDKMHTAEAAVVALNDNPDMHLSMDAQQELLEVTDSRAIILEQFGSRRFILTMELPTKIDYQINMSDMTSISWVINSISFLFLNDDSFLRVIGKMDVLPGNLELIVEGHKLRDDMWGFAGNVLLLSLVIALFTAILIYMSMRWLIIRPIQKISNNMVAFSDAPEDKTRVIHKTRREDEIGIAQNQLRQMQGDLQAVLGEKQRLANLGLAVSKINHDMRNILTSALLFSDRLNAVDDPKVQSFAPKLVSTIERATEYTKEVLEYGKVREANPEQKAQVSLNDIGENVAELLGLDHANDVRFENKTDKNLEVYCDREQLFRVLMNLSRNSVQAMRENVDSLDEMRLVLAGFESDDHVVIHLSDSGPGIPEKAREKLFTAFEGSTKSGGTGLGLAIVSEIIEAHKGNIRLLQEGEAENFMGGACFEITLPKE